MLAAMTDHTKKAAALRELAAAEDMLARRDEAGCMTRARSATGMMR